MRKIIAFALIAACIMGLFAGCGDVVSEVADSVLTAAKAELEKQIQAKVQEYKVTVLETKTVFGDLNGGKYQFYCAFLVQTDSESSASDCAEGLGKVFENSGFVKQTESKVQSDKLVNKEITYDNADFTADNYYTVYVYVEDVTKVVDLNKLNP